MAVTKPKQCSYESIVQESYVENPNDPNASAQSVVVENPNDIVFGTVGTPTIYNVPASLSNTEYSQALSANTKKFTIKVRGKADLKLAYTATESATNYITIPAGAVMFIDGLNASGLTLYFQTTKASQIVEIQEWV